MKDDDRTLFLYGTDSSLLAGKTLQGYHAYVLCRQGEATFRYHGEQHRLRRDSAAVFTRPDKVAYLCGSDDFELEYVAIAAWWLHTLVPHDHYGVVCSLTMYDKPVLRLSNLQARRMHTDLLAIASRTGEWQQPFYREQVGSLCRLMIYDFYGCHALAYKGVVPSGRQSVVVRRLLELLEGGAAKTQRSVAWYAQQLELTPKQLGDLVLAGTGYNVTALIERYAVAHICELLDQQDMPAVEIARQMHFSSLPHLSRYASKRLGMTISEYRQKIKTE